MTLFAATRTASAPGLWLNTSRLLKHRECGLGEVSLSRSERRLFSFCFWHVASCHGSVIRARLQFKLTHYRKAWALAPQEGAVLRHHTAVLDQETAPGENPAVVGIIVANHFELRFLRAAHILI
jgi:hypothetical protein